MHIDFGKLPVESTNRSCKLLVVENNIRDLLRRIWLFSKSASSPITIVYKKKGRLGEIDKGGMVALLRQRGPSFLGMLAGNAGSIKQRNHDHDESEAAGAAQL